MEQTREARAPTLAARGCWQGARRDAWRVARRLYRTQVGAGVDQRDAGAWRDDCVSCGPELGVGDGRGEVPGSAGHRAMGPFVPAWSERRETAVVGITALTTADQDGMPEHGRQHTRCAVQATPRHVVGGRKWPKRASGPGGNAGFLPKAPVDNPLQPFDDDDDRRLIEHGGRNARPQPWSGKHPPQKTARAVGGHVRCTVRMVALATASRRQGEPAALGQALVDWPRWRRPRLEQRRDHGIVLAQDGDGLLPRAADARLLGGTRPEGPPGLGTRQDIFAHSGLAARR